MSVTLTLCSILIVYLVIYKYLKNRRFWKHIYEFNGDRTVPIFGNALSFKLDSVEILKKITEMWERHGKSTFRVINGYDVFVALNDPETVEIVLSSNTEIMKMDDYTFLKSWLGDGLLLSTGNKWRRRRKIITPTFHFKILEQFVSIFNNKGDIFLKKLSENKEKIFDVYPYVTLSMLDIISESAMGTSINAQLNSNSEYVRAVYRLSKIIHFRSYSTWKRFPFLYIFSSDYREEKRCLKILHDTTNSIIKSRKVALKNLYGEDFTLNEESFGEEKKLAFLDLLLLSKTPEGEHLPDEAVREEVDTFMFEGHDTTSSAVSFALYLLSINPKEQQLAFEEQLELFGDDLQKHVTLRDLQEMKYLERVIKETLRIYPSVPFYGRKSINDIKLPDGKIIPAGTFVTIQPYLMGRNPKYYSDPLKFDPDRFLPDNVQKQNPFLFAPFSAGPRNCIGQKFAMLEMKSILSKVLRNFEIFSAGLDFEPLLAAELILRSKNGLHLLLKDRIYTKK